jgi:hypothetical protein
MGPAGPKKHVGGIPDLAARKNHVAGIPGRPREKICRGNPQPPARKKIMSRESWAVNANKKACRGNPGSAGPQMMQISHLELQECI